MTAKGSRYLLPAAFFFSFFFQVCGAKSFFLEQLLFWLLIAVIFFIFKSFFSRNFNKLLTITCATLFFTYGLLQKLIIFPALISELQAGNNFFSRALLTRLQTGRIYSLFSLPTLYAFVCGFLIIIILDYLLGSRKKLIWLILLAAGIVNLLLTQTIAAFFYTAIAAFFLLARKRIITLKYFLPFLMLLTLTFSLILALRFHEIRNLSPLHLRLLNWQQATRVIAAFPLSGVGPGNYQAKISAFTFSGEPVSIYAHNFFLQFTAETGLPVALFLFATLAGYLWKHRRQFLKTENSLPVSLLILFFFYNLIDIGIYNPVASILLGITLAMFARNSAGDYPPAIFAGTSKKVKSLLSLVIILIFCWLQLAKYFQLAGNLELAFNNLDKARKYYQASILIYPLQFYSLVGLADIAFRSNNPARSKLFLAKAEKINPDYPFLYYLHSQINLQEKNLVAALNNALLAAGKAPYNQKYRSNYEILAQQTAKILSAAD